MYILTNLKVVRMTELIDQSLRSFGLFHNTLLVVLPYRSAELVVVHGRPVLPFAPQTGHFDRVFDFEYALGAIQPPDTRAV